MPDANGMPVVAPAWRKLPDVQSSIAVLIITAVILLIFLMALTGKTETDTFKIMVGGLMTVGFAAVISFYFGSSQGSKSKDETISAMVGNAPPTPAASSSPHAPAG